MFIRVYYIDSVWNASAAMLSFTDKLLHLSLPDADRSRKGRRLTPYHRDVCFKGCRETANQSQQYRTVFLYKAFVTGQITNENGSLRLNLKLF